MGVLTALVPWPYRILAMIALVVAVVGSAYIKGRMDEGDRRDVAAAKAEGAMLKVQAGREKKIVAVVTASKIKQTKIESEGAIALQRITERASPPASDCPVPLPPERMRNILSAWGIPARDRPEGNGAVVRDAESTGK
jgi:hypothetical protein